MSFLLDTDTCSAYFRQVGTVTNRFIQYTGRLYLSVISLGELYSWVLRQQAPPSRQLILQQLLKEVRVLDLNSLVAEKFGEVRAHLLDIGKPMPTADLFIAATALVHGLTLVTHNTQDYINVPGLALADWLVP
jgi:tRNA(fMet)-specific endonuclease VapC